jgi:hypothetical protein
LYGSASETDITIRDAVSDRSFGSDPQWKIRADQILLQCGGEIFTRTVFQSSDGQAVPRQRAVRPENEREFD